MTTSIADLTRFTAVDTAPDPEPFIRFLDAVGELPSFVSLKTRILARLELRPGQRVLDAGCGTGMDARRMAERVAPGGSVVGIDASQAMIDVSQARSEGSGLAVEFRSGDAAALDFPDASFDAATIDRVLVHMAAEPEQAVAELHRVLRPGGRLVGFDVDLDGTLVDGPDPRLARRVIDVAADAYRNARIGRRLPAVLADAGFVADVTPHGLVLPRWLFAALFEAPVAAAGQAGRISAADVDEWWAALEAAEKAGRFFSCFSGFVFSARKP